MSWPIPIARYAILTIVLCSWHAPKLHAQGLDNLWMGGFENWAPVPFGGSDINFGSSTATISVETRTVELKNTTANITDAQGNLLFFTNGVVVANNLGSTMQGGGGLNPSY